MTLNELIEKLSNQRDQLLESNQRDQLLELNQAGEGGISYRLQQPELKQLKENCNFQHALTERLNLHRHAAIALLQTAEVDGLDALKV
ncbi:MAG: hypothetical protein FJ186_03800, partial [Gammaproteobacteria bacterium]|nr:hypothetical protein [Gammaproteobacteria bacterium]